MTAFEIAYKKLNSAQREAVDAIEGPVMVIAGPGTGKTTILTLRIANILKRTDTPPHGILAITYTDAGVRAMREKLYGIIGDRAHDVRIHTFHSFAASVMAEYQDHFLHLDGMKQMTEIEQEVLVRSIIEDPKFSDLRPVGRPDAYVFGILRSMDDAKREALTPEMVGDFAKRETERVRNDEASISSRGVSKGGLKAEARELIAKCERTLLFADIYGRYEREKREAKRLDFNDLIIELLVALREDELLLRLVQERYLYIHVDEHQDTNDSQNFIIALIAEFFDTPNLFIVGDEKQAIYRFQGASVENFLLLRKRWPAMKVISLDGNYRSHQSILDASFGMIERNYEGDEHKDLRIRLKAPKVSEKVKRGKGEKKEAAVVEAITAQTVNAAETELVRRVCEISSADPKATVALIVRRNRDLDRVIRLLEASGVGVSSERSVDIFKHPAGALFFDLIEYLSDPAKTEALAKTIIAGMWNIGIERGAELSRAMRSGRTVDVEKVLPTLARIRSKILVDSSVGFIIEAARHSGYIEIIAKDPSYVHIWRGIVALAESLARESRIVAPAELMKSMLAYRTSAESKPVKVSVGAPDVPVRAMTAHGSKGLEFDYVFIPYATEEAWVGRPRGASFVLPKKHAVDSDIRDLRRLFYVALTRARRRVVIFMPLEESDGSMLSPLRFVEELDSANVTKSCLEREKPELPEISTEYPVPSTQSDKLGTRYSAPGTKLTDISKRVLLESGLSVTALNHFVECPNKFIYQSIVKLPQAPAAAAEKGSAMHEAFARVWKSPEKNATATDKIMKDSIREYFERSYLPALEKQAVMKELIASAPLVAKALESHFAMKGTVFTEFWVKAVFEGNFGGEPIRIPLHGKIDAIVDTSHDVCVFDYKTRQAMSTAAIRGETKNSDGNYFRQLVFYKILAGSDPRWKSRNVVPALVFVSPDEKGRCPIVTLPITDADAERVKKEIQSVLDAVWSGEISAAKCTEMGCEWCGLRSLA